MVLLSATAESTLYSLGILGLLDNLHIWLLDTQTCICRNSTPFETSQRTPKRRKERQIKEEAEGCRRPALFYRCNGGRLTENTRDIHIWQRHSIQVITDADNFDRVNLTYCRSASTKSSTIAPAIVTAIVTSITTLINDGPVQRGTLAEST